MNDTDTDDDGLDSVGLDGVGQVALGAPALRGDTLEYGKGLGADLAVEEPADERGLVGALTGRVCHSATQGDAAVEDPDDGEELLRQPGTVGAAGESTGERVAARGRGSAGGTLHQMSPPSALAVPTFSRTTSPDSSSARKRSTMPF